MESKNNINKLKDYQNALVFSQFISSQSLGRRHSLEEDDEDALYFGALDPFFIDKEKLRSSRSLERLNQVSQFAINYHGRLPVHLFNHTTQVLFIATTAAKILGLNISLVEAMVLLHDIGHPFCGHLGEKIISDYSGREFSHATMSIITTQKIERLGKGLNLSWETLEGALCHPRANRSLACNTDKPLEYTLVSIADKLASMLYDPGAALYYKHFKPEDLPKEFFELGNNYSQRVFNCILSLVRESAEKQTISFVESETAQRFERLRQWNYQNFYPPLDRHGPRHKLREDFKRAYSSLLRLFEELDQDIFLGLALMTDKEILKIIEIANNNHQAIFKKNFFKQFPVFDILFSLPEKQKISIFNADMDKKKFKRFDYLA